MAQSHKDQDVCEQHPFGVEATIEKGGLKSTYIPNGRNNLGDGISGIKKNAGGKSIGFWKSYKKDVCFSLLFVISAGAIAVLAAYTIKTEQKMNLLEAQMNEMAKQINTPVAKNDVFKNESSKIGDEVFGMIRNQIDALENQSGAQWFKVEKALLEIGDDFERLTNQMDDFRNQTDAQIFILETAFFEIGEKVEQFTTKLDALENKTEVHDSKINVLETSSEKDCDSPVKSTMNASLTAMQESSTAITLASATIASPSIAPNAFQVLKANETVYLNYNFLTLQVRVPYDGLSASENWCRDYENLCKQFGRRPTGCGVFQMTADKYKDCAAVYNSDMNIDNVLGCTPSAKVTRLVKEAFPEWSPEPIVFQNAFGFHKCDAENCKKTMKDSKYALYLMADFWMNNKTTMYTVCR